MGQEGSHIRLGPVRSVVTMIVSDHWSVAVLNKRCEGRRAAEGGELGLVHYSRNCFIDCARSRSVLRLLGCWSVEAPK